LCHNTFGHYHNIGMKFGYDLLNLKEKGQVTIVEPMKIIASNVHDTVYFIRYLRSFISLSPLSQLCILAHAYQENLQTSNADTIANALKYMSHLCVATQPFRTGHSSDASGKLTVYWKTDSVRSKYHWLEKTTHLFELLDWQVKICAPGTTSVLS
ncbi:hypothetical protein ALC60_05263, partial [Trachymyrmex zeteki]